MPENLRRMPVIQTERVSVMHARRFIDKLRRSLIELRASQSGNVIVTFALMLIPLMGFVGAAVDYSHANSIKAEMQAALDATALAMSKTAGSMTNTDLQ